MEDALGQSSQQLRSFQENFEKVLAPPTVQVSDPPWLSCNGVRLSPLFPPRFVASMFPVTQGRILLFPLSFHSQS